HGINVSVSTLPQAVSSTSANIHFEESWLEPLAQPGAAAMPPDQYGDLIFFTSGTTGAPKKVVHRNRAMQIRFELSDVQGFADYTHILIIVGASFRVRFTRVCDALLSGRTVCLASVSEELLRMVSTFKVDYVFASPNQARVLCELAEKHPQYDLQSLKAICLGRAKVPQSLVGEIRARLCRHVVVNYGSTETWRVAGAPYDAIAHIPNAVGVLMPWAVVQIVDEDDRPMPTGQEGRV